MARNDTKFTKLREFTTTITSGTETDLIDIGGGSLNEVYIPAGIASSTMKILKSRTASGLLSNLHDGLGTYGLTADITFSIVADKWVVIPPSLAAGFQFFKLQFDVSETSKSYILTSRSIT